MSLGEMTREGCINIFREMIEKEIRSGGSLEKLREKINERWPQGSSSFTSLEGSGILQEKCKKKLSEISVGGLVTEAPTGKMSPDNRAFLVKTLSKGVR